MTLEVQQVPAETTVTVARPQQSPPAQHRRGCILSVASRSCVLMIAPLLILVVGFHPDLRLSRYGGRRRQWPFSDPFCRQPCISE